MPDKMNPVVTIILDKERHLKLTLGAMLAFEEVTGKDLRDKEAIESLLTKTTLKEVRALLWACLRHEDQTLTLERVGDIVEHIDLNKVMRAIYDAWIGALPEPEKGKADTDPLAASPQDG